jgi:hypothetical protein
MAEWANKSGPAPGAAHIEGRVRLVIGDAPVGVLKVERGTVEILPDGDAPAVLLATDRGTLMELLGGDLHPVVARLQHRAVAEGDNGLALRILLGLRAGSPWSSRAVKSKHR